jgi:hypothetical protein
VEGGDGGDVGVEGLDGVSEGGDLSIRVGGRVS